MMIDGSENTNVSWLLNFRIRMFLKSTCTNLLPERFGLSKPVHLVAGIFFFNDSSIKALDSLLLEDTMSTFPLLKSQQNNTENSM